MKIKASNMCLFKRRMRIYINGLVRTFLITIVYNLKKNCEYVLSHKRHFSDGKPAVSIFFATPVPSQ